MCSTPFRVILGLLNTIFGIIGLVITVLGAIMNWGRPIVEKLVEKLMNQLQDKLGDDLKQHADEVSKLILDLSQKVGLFVFIFGLVIFVISILGCIGACCNLKCFLMIYAAIIVIIIAAHIIILIFYFSRKDIPRNFINKELVKLVHKYQSITSGNPESILLGIFMPMFNCCGFTNGSDFYDQNADFTHKEVLDGKEVVVQFPVPCCKISEQIASIGSATLPPDVSADQLNRTCPYQFTTENSNIHTGCGDLIDDFVFKLVDFVAYVSIGVLLFNILVFFMTVLAIAL